MSLAVNGIRSMSIRIEEVGAADRDQWDRAVERSPQTTYFHRYDALDSLARYFDATVHPLMGYVGQEPVGVFPVFEQSRGPLVLATSPPLSVEIHAGPALLNFRKLKQRKAEKRHQEFIDNCLQWTDAIVDPDLRVFKVSDRYSDVRPFLRNEFDASPSYTYVLDLAPELDELQARFSSDARQNVRNTPEDAYTIEEGGEAEIEAVVSLVAQRFDELDEYYWLESGLVRDLHSGSGRGRSSSDPESPSSADESADDGAVRPYVCRSDGRIVGGILALEHGDTVYRWQSGTRPDADVPATDLLDWHVIREAKEKGLGRYDLVGAMIPRLCEYKSKFGPEPAPVYVVTDGNLTAKLAEGVYDRMPESVRRLVGI